jgi:hypothetical protein
VDGELQPHWTSSVPATGLLAAGCGNDHGSYVSTAVAVANHERVVPPDRVGAGTAPSDADCAAYKARTGQDRPSLAAVRLQDLTPEVASRHLALLLERGRREGGGLRPRTVRGVRITLNAALASAYASGKLLRPVRVKRIVVPKRPPTVYSPEQTGSFLDEGVELPPVVQAVVADDAPGGDAVVVVGAGMGSSGMISRTTKAPSGALRTTWMSPSNSRLA